MKSLIYFLSLIFLFYLSSCSSEERKKPGEKDLTELRSAAGDFMGKLKTVLVNEMQNNGVVEAVNVCSDTAQILTEQIGDSKNLFIKRVSDKNRNPNNAPDEFETAVIEKFKQLHAANQIDASTEYAEIIDSSGKKIIRYMKPIIIQNECLTCHGSKEYIPDAVNEIIITRYPNDKARGYSPGELRGAVSITKEINN